jgi:hypothetical protein
MFKVEYIWITVYFKNLSLADNVWASRLECLGSKELGGFRSFHGFFCELSQHMRGGSEETYEERQTE